ncbi:MAG: hypothetical protein ACR2NU_06160, partial [Aeoliella sp.]
PDAQTSPRQSAKLKRGGLSALDNSEPWPVADVNSVVAHDPFLPPYWAGVSLPPSELPSTPAKDVAKTSNAALEKLVASGTTVVVIVDGERLALVGDRQIRVGDRLDGFMVTAITESGVVLSGEGEEE